MVPASWYHHKPGLNLAQKQSARRL
jgi:hypothetical protein